MREAPAYAAILGLGFGDCGKGLFTDALCRRWHAHTVVRFNGGAQAGHNVVLPDGRQHTFAQFGAGTFVAGVHTVLAAPVVVHPAALLVESACLQRHGVADALSRLLVDGRCRITTPFHQAAGRLRELLRGTAAHGSCGVGVGETVKDSLAWPQATLCYADLFSPWRARERLEHIRQRLLADPAWELAGRSAAERGELAVLHDEGIAAHWLAHLQELLRQVPAAAPEQIAERLLQGGTVLFEGAQGALLDEWHGFHPHTTWSTTRASAADAVARDYGIATPVTRLGVLRSYLTRHGAGPFPTQDAALDVLAEPHNASDGWQGRFRRGHPDGVLLRYVRAVSGPFDGLLLSHLDVFSRNVPLRWCDAYADSDGVTRRDLAVCARQDLAHQELLARDLQRVQPQYAAELLTAAACMERCSTELQCPVWFTAAGCSHARVREI